MVGAPVERLALDWKAGVVLLCEGLVCRSSLLGRDKLQRDLFVLPTGETCILVGPLILLIDGACGGSLVVTALRFGVRCRSTSVGFGFGGKFDDPAQMLDLVSQTRILILLGHFATELAEIGIAGGSDLCDSRGIH